MGIFDEQNRKANAPVTLTVTFQSRALAVKMVDDLIAAAFKAERDSRQCRDTGCIGDADVMFTRARRLRELADQLFAARETVSP